MGWFFGYDSISDAFDGGGKGGASDLGFSTSDHADYLSDFKDTFGFDDPTAQDHGNITGHEGTEGDEDTGTSWFTGNPSDGTSDDPGSQHDPSAQRLYLVDGVTIDLGVLAGTTIGDGIVSGLTDPRIRAVLNDLPPGVNRVELAEKFIGTWASSRSGNTVTIDVNQGSFVNAHINPAKG